MKAHWDWLRSWPSRGLADVLADVDLLGYRVAAWLDEEQAEGGMAWLLDLQYAEYIAAEQQRDEGVTQ